MTVDFLDVVLQFSSNSFAHRFAELAAADAAGGVTFLPPFLKGVRYSTPAGRDANMLVFLHRVPCAPSELLGWLRTSVLSATCHRVLVVRGDRRAASLEELVEQLRQQAACFQRSGAGGGGGGGGGEGGRVRLMCFPKSLESEVGELIHGDVSLQPVNYESIVCVVRTAIDADLASSSNGGVNDAPAAVGAAAAGSQTPVAGGARYVYTWHELTAAEYGGPCIAPTPLEQLRVGAVVARAVAKVHEVAALLLRPGGALRLGPGDAVIDIGASPGSWTAYLAAVLHVGTVVAVDPAELDPGVLALPGVVHVRKVSHEAVDDVRAALAAAPHAADLTCTPTPDGKGDGAGGQQVRLADALVCDMNRHPGRLAELLNGVLGLLRPGGLVVLTLKFIGKGYERGRFYDVLRRELGEELGLVDMRFLWLFANTASERCMVARYQPGEVKRLQGADPAPGAVI